MYVNQRILARRRKQMQIGVGDFWTDFVNSITGGDPNANIPTTPEDIDTGPTVQVSTIGGQVSSIPSSQAGGGWAATGGFVSTNGVCKPTDSVSLAAFKELQRQANRVADATGLAKIGVDGAIGPGTIGLISQIKTKAQSLAAQYTSSQGWGNYLANQNVSTCSAIAGGVQNLTPMLSAMADALGVSSSVASPAPASPPSIYNPITGAAMPQGAAADAGDLIGNMSTTMQIAGLAIAGGLAYFAVKAYDKKKGRK